MTDTSDVTPIRQIFIIGLILLAGTTLVANQVIHLADEVLIPLPEGWVQVPGDDYPFHFADTVHLAEILIFKSNLTANESIADEDELYEAVEAVATEVLPELQKPQMLHSSGFLEEGRAWFVLDFLSSDTLLETRIFHRLKGVLFRKPDNSQLLFTLWARTSPDDLPYSEPSIDAMLYGFAYQGPFEASVFNDNRSRQQWYLPLGVMLLLGIVIYLRRFRTNQGTIRFAESKTLWRCDCGRVNHIDRPTCRRCGQEKLVV